MLERRSRRRPPSELFPELSDAKSHLLKAQKELLLAVRSVLDKAIERSEERGKKRKSKTIKKVEIK